MKTANNNSQQPEITIALGHGVGAKVTSETLAWDDFTKKLSMAPADDVSSHEYRDLPKAERLSRKSSRGYFVMGHFPLGVRSKPGLEYRTGLAIDIEGGATPMATIVEAVKAMNYKAFIYSTRSSSEDLPRYRLIIPYNKPAETDAAVEDTRHVVNTLEMFGIDCDMGASTTSSQPAFLPTVSNDQPFEREAIEGDWLQPGAVYVQNTIAEQRFQAMDLKAPSGATRETIIGALKAIRIPGYTEDYHWWIKVGQCIYHETSGGFDGLEMWDQWSQIAGNYEGFDVCENKWRSFSDSSTSTVTIRTVFHEAKRAGWSAADATFPENESTLIQLGHEADLPPREWVIGHRLMKGYITIDLAPGGVGKSVFGLVTAAAIALGRDDMTGDKVHRPGNVWVINYEDDSKELRRRLFAIMNKFEIDPLELDTALYVDSWYGLDRQLAREFEGGVVATKWAEMVVDFIKEKDIQVLVIDPLVAIHNVNENDNGMVNAVARVLRSICDKTGVALLAAHHTPKGSGVNTEAHAGNADAGRGASSLRDAARAAFTLSRMSDTTAQAMGIPDADRNRYLRYDSAKSNFSLPDNEATWLKLETVQLANGDQVGVPVPFDMGPLIEEASADRDALELEIRLSYAVDIVSVVEGGSARLSRVRDSLMSGDHWGLGRSAAENRINLVLPTSRERALAVSTLSGPVLVWLELGINTSPSSVMVEELGGANV